MKDEFYELKDLKVQPKSVKVRSYSDISINFSLNNELPYNSSLTFRIRGGRNNKNDWYFLQPYDAAKKGYVKLSLSPKVKLIPILLTGKDLEIKYLVCEKDGIKEESIFKFTIFNTLVQSIVEKDKRIEILVEIPNQKPKILEPIPSFKVYNDEFSHITLICPSTINVNENFKLLLRIEDKFYNTVENFTGTIKLFQTMNSKKIFIKEINFDKSCKGILTVDGLKFSEYGIYQIEALYNNQNFKSNPIVCYKENLDKKLYWGYIHGHSNISDGVADPYSYFKNLKNAGLDFGTITEHDHLWETSDKDFEEIKQIVNTYNKNGEFVSFFGYEWGYWYTGGFGDICIYHFDENIPILRSDINKYNSTTKLLKALLPYKEKVLLIGHHTALRPGFRNWENFNNDLEKLVEIYSTWGNQEYSFKKGNPLPPRYKLFGYGKFSKKNGPILEKENGFVQKALQKGYKLGFVAGGDDHFGIYPSGAMNPDNGIYPSGIMAVWADKLDKLSIWNALSNRSCYGTTGPRVILEFNINDYCMGNIIDLKYHYEFSSKRNIYSKIISPINIIRLELIRNDEIIESLSINSSYFEYKYSDNYEFKDISLQHSQNTNEQFIFYYLRIFLSNNNMAWSSPIWIIKKE